MSFVGAIKEILRSSPVGLTPQEIRRIIKRKYPDYYATASHKRNVEKGHYKDLDHALLAQIYTATRNSKQIVADRSEKPVRLSVGGEGSTEQSTHGVRRRGAVKPGVQPPRPTLALIREYLRQWERLENYRLQEQSLSLLFREVCPRNDQIEHVLLKVSALNDFYSTNIFDSYSVANHIFSQKIDQRLHDVDHALVNDIALIETGGKTKNNYSFATKYCSHHLPDDYPVYDSFVEKMLVHYKDADGFDSFLRPDLKKYERFLDVVLNFRNFYGLQDLSLREIDVFLWLAGKEYFPKNYRKRRG